MRNKMLQRAKELYPQIVENRRQIHQNPEVGLDLPETIAFVQKKLTQAGLEVKNCGKGLTACIGKQGKTILLRADMDALPVPEETELPFRASNGNGHLCGHDMHTAMLISAAQILKENEAVLSGTVKFMFQPSEEMAEGAKNMIAAGILEDPKVDAAIGLHVMSNKKNGEVSCVKGVGCSSIDGFLTTVKGKGGHGSMPEDTVDPLFAVNSMYNMFNGLVGRESSAFRSAVLTVGQMGGGKAANIIPETAVFNGSLRCFDDQVRDRLVQRMQEIVEYTAKATGVSCDFKLYPSPSLYNDPGLCGEMEAYIKEITGEENFVDEKEPMLGSEDFSYVSKKVPTMFLWMGTGDLDYLPVHNPKVKFEEDYLYRGTAVMAYCAYKWLEYHGKERK